jgi:RNA polymerase sigma-70 factor (ECF subfamily)
VTPAGVVGRIARGDPEAITAVYEDYHGQLSRFCLRLTGSPDDAADLVQETFLRFVKQAPRLGDDVALPAYLLTMARNLYYKQLRSRRREVLDDEAGAAVATEALEDDPARAALLAERQREVWRACLRLPPRQREALALREVEDLSYDDVGSVMGLKRNAVAQLLLRSRLSLRRELRLEQLDVERLPAEVVAALPALAAYLDGELEEPEREEVVALLERSPDARAALAALASAGETYRGVVLLPVPIAIGGLASLHAAAGAAGGHAAAVGIARLVPRSPGHVAAAGGAGATVVVAAAIAVAALRGGSTPPPAPAPAAPVAPAPTIAAAPAVTTPPKPRPKRKHVRRPPPAPSVVAAPAPPPPRPNLVLAGVAAARGPRIVVTVANEGTGTAPPTSLRVAVAGQAARNVPVPALRTGASAALRVPIACPAETVRVTATVDGSGDVAESSFRDNVSTARLALPCDAPPAGPTAAPTPLPDLVVTDVAAAGRTLAIAVANVGAGAARATTLRIETVADGVLTALLPPVPVGRSRQVDVPWPCTAAHDTVTVRIDPGGTVRQSDRANDVATATLDFVC